MSVDWNELVEQIMGLGAPLVGGALGGPLGASAGKILADALGAVEATPGAIKTAIAEKGADLTAIAAAAREADEKFAAALVQVGQSQVTEVAQTQRAEIQSGNLLQKSWRPMHALELSLIECPAFSLTLLHALWTGFEPAITGFGTLSGLLMMYFGARFGILGVYVSGRTREKVAAATGEVVPGIVAGLSKVLKKK